MDQWLILDDDGVIDSGTEEEMRSQWNLYTTRAEVISHNGDLLLVSIEEVWNG